MKKFLVIGVLGFVLQASFGQATPTPTPNQIPQQATATQESDYLLGPGDACSIVVIGHAEYSGDFSVPDGGWINLPEVGDVNVNGMTLSHLRDYVVKKLKKELLKPRVAVVLKTPRIRVVSLSGDVQKPGAVPFVPGERLADIYNASGGILPGLAVQDAQVTVIARDGSKTTIPLYQVLTGAPSSNLIVKDGDNVVVDSGGFSVYVTDQVAKPGIALIRKGGNVLQAIAVAGGATTTAAIDKVRITHTDGTTEVLDLTPELVYGQEKNLAPLKSGDLIQVPLITAQYTVIGYVGQPGLYPMPPGQIVTLSDAISTAKGHDASHRARFSRVMLIRKKDGKMTHSFYNFSKYISKGDETQNPQIFAGDFVYVPETDQINPAIIVGALGAAGIFYNGVK